MSAYQGPHTRLPSGQCLHVWRNRQRRPVDCLWAEGYEAATREILRRGLVAAEPRPSAYCGDCDGVGWVEGGSAIKTTCSTCGGTGREPR